MKTKKKTLIAGVITVVVSLLGILWGISNTSAQSSQHPKPSPTPEILENGWHRFTDTKAGYSFDYPPGSLSISVGRDKGEKYDHLTIQFSEIQGYGYQGMVLYVLPNPKRLSIEEFMLTEFTGRWTEKAPPTSLSESDIGEFFIVGGNTAIKTTLSNYVEIESAPYFVYIANGNTIISTGPLYGLIGGSGIAPETEILFSQILETFTFYP